MPPLFNALRGCLQYAMALSTKAYLLLIPGSLEKVHHRAGVVLLRTRDRAR
jgi:hypothetical protein